VALNPRNVGLAVVRPNAGQPEGWSGPAGLYVPSSPGLRARCDRTDTALRLATCPVGTRIA